MATDSRPYDAKFWEEARIRSLEPGGFGKDRVEIWMKLLNVEASSDEEIPDMLPEHADERQIRLDTDRSFVLYPDGDVQGHQEELNALLVSIFRKHPSLSYFQGFHDIITVIFLTLPPPLRFPCAEKLSLHRTRDAMGVGLEPVLGLLRFLAQLIAAVDEKLAKLLKHAAPLPYFALSHLLTMLAHDVPTLPLIQHVFDYLLARPPIALVYLVAAMIIERKDELFALNDEDGDLGMLHSLLGALPSMSDGPEPLETEGISAAGPSLIPDPSFPCSVAETATVVANSDELGSSAEDTDETDTLAESDCYSDSDTMKTETVVDIFLHDTENRKAESPLSSPSPLLGRSPTPPLQVHSESELFSSPPPLYSDDQEITPNDADTSPLSTSPSSPLDLLDEKQIPSGSVSPNSEGTYTPSRRKPSIPIELSSLLRSADQLLEAYPPYEGYPVSVGFDQASHTLPDTCSDIPSSSPSSNPSLIPTLSSIMGPLSVIYTWSEDPACLPTTSDAEEIVKNGVDIVLPWDPSLDTADSDEEEGSFGEEEKAREDVKKRRRIVRGHPQKLMLGLGAGAGAALVIAIALAVYGSYGVRSARGHGIGDRISLESLLGVLGAWGWARFG